MVSPIIPFVPPIVPPLPGVPALMGQIQQMVALPGQIINAAGQVVQQVEGIGANLAAGNIAGALGGAAGLAAAIPGGGQVAGILGGAANLAGLAQGDFNAIFSGFGGQRQWGIFSQGGGQILPVDAVYSVEYAKEFRISDYPQEQGAFASYNKVQMPFQAKIGFLLKTNRIAFMQKIQKQLESLDFVTVVTPEISYPSANLMHFGYRRVAKEGVSMILVEVWVQEVRVTGTVGQATPSTATASPNGATPGNNGQVTPGNTTTTPKNYVTGNLESGLPAPGSPTPSNPLPSPNVPSAFYNADNLPEVPNEVAKLSGPQQDTSLSLGSNLGVTSQTVYTPPAAAGPGSSAPDTSAPISYKWVGAPS